MTYYSFVGLVGVLILLAGCEPTSQSQTSVADKLPSSVDSEGRSLTQDSVQPIFAVNELENGLIPSAPQMGQLAIRNNCIVFVTRDQLAMPLWPAGTKFEQQSDNLVIKIPGRADLTVPSTTSIGGAFVPLNSKNMTKFSKPLPKGCPAATFAVAKP